jgi:hypothetical protein
MGRHQRRASFARFRREVPGTLRTFLCEPDDDRLDRMPLLRRASQHWLNDLSSRVRHCLLCSAWIVSRDDVGALLMSVPDIPRPVSAGTAAICLACWRDEPPVDALERACASALRSVVPGGRFEPLIAREKA